MKIAQCGCDWPMLGLQNEAVIQFPIVRARAPSAIITHDKWPQKRNYVKVHGWMYGKGIRLFQMLVVFCYFWNPKSASGQVRYVFCWQIMSCDQNPYPAPGHILRIIMTLFFLNIHITLLLKSFRNSTSVPGQRVMQKEVKNLSWHFPNHRLLPFYYWSRYLVDASSNCDVL